MTARWGWLVLLLGTGIARSDEVDGWLRDLRAVSHEAGGAEKARLAWGQLVKQGPVVLPRVLAAMDTPDTVAANWLRTAFDRIVESARAANRPIDTAMLRTFAADRKRQGRARRLALDLLEQLRPGSREPLLAEALEDPEFRYDAIEQALARLGKQQLKEEVARRAYRRLFDASRDQEQGRTCATELKKLGVEVSLADHLGFVRRWHLVGPFDGKQMKGFQHVYPPEKAVDLQATLEGKEGKKLTWKPWEVKETWTGRHQALVDLRAALGDAEDAVGYAHTIIRVKEPREVEFRGAADDNFTVWVNGARAFGFEEYRNGVRLDRHRFRVKLKAGDNTILVKVCQGALDETHRELNWEFLLRVCDETGKGIAFEQN